MMMITQARAASLHGWRTFSAWGARNPAALNATAGVVLGGTGDVLAQKLEGAKQIDFKRTACVCLWYGPAAVLFWTPYLAMQERVFGSRGARALLSKVLTYNLAMASVDISGFYMVSLTPQIGAQKAWETLRDGYRDTAAAGICLWGPAMTLIYWKVPAHLVMTTSYALDTVWACTMSYLSNRKGDKASDLTQIPTSTLHPHQHLELS